MDAQAINLAISTAVNDLKKQVDSQQAILKAALDKEFTDIRSEAAKATQDVKDTFTLADQQVRTDQQTLTDKMTEIGTSVEDLDLRMGEQDNKLQKYEAQQHERKPQRSRPTELQ